MYDKEIDMGNSVLRDRLWLWGMKVNILQDTGQLKYEESTMTTEDAIRKTGITNVLMAGQLEINRETLDSMPSAKRIICKWGLHRSRPEGGTILDFDRCALRLRATKELASQDTRIDGFLIDDFSTGTVDAGVMPDDIARLQYINAAEHPHLPLMGTIYTLSLDKPELPGLLPFFASYLTPLWHAADINQFSGDIDRLSVMSGGKPQLLCIYLYDFGNGKRASRDLMRRQLDTVEMLIRSDKVVGAVVLGTNMMDLPWEATECFYEWLEDNGSNPM